MFSLFNFFSNSNVSVDLNVVEDIGKQLDINNFEQENSNNNDSINCRKKSLKMHLKTVV